MIKLLAALFCSILPFILPAQLNAADHAAFSGLALAAEASGPGLDPATPQPGLAQMVSAMGQRFPTTTHINFNADLTLRSDRNDREGDFYPFAGGTPGKTDENGNPVDRGILSGMGSEDGHPSLFANGGDTKKLWKKALEEYKNLRFPAAYELIGLVCHLTQDQAVPAHAANINHVITFGDAFEGSVKRNMYMFDKLKAKAEAMVIPSLQPYEYYQVLQDDTRSRLAGWVDPRSGRPYWPPAADAPPLGQDATSGPWSHYSDREDTYDKNVSPDIIRTQTVKAAAFTEGVLRSAARLLPPVAGRIKAIRKADKPGSEVDLTMDIYDNRHGEIEIKIERPLYGLTLQKEADVYSSEHTIPSVTFRMFLPAVAFPVAGKDMLLITLTDQDGNVSRSEAQVVDEVAVDYSAAP